MGILINSDKVVSFFKEKRIGVLCGGLSGEREVSLRSGKNVFDSLKSFGLDVELIDVGRDIAVQLIKKKIDYVYNILHGLYGEDGVIQGTLDMLGIGYTGENVLVSATCMNKVRTKEIWNYNGVSTSIFAVLKDFNYLEEDKIVFKNGIELTFPIVIKPIIDGSSLNVFIVKTAEQLNKLINSIDKNKFFAESYVKGKEITVGVINVGNETRCFPILGINPKNEFYDYDAKYTENMTDFEIPAKIDKFTEEKVCNIAKKAYEVLDCEGICRIDIIIEENTNVPYLLEINTQPGMTNNSDVPQMIKHEEIKFDDFVLYVLGKKVIV